jgi:hypothetical protein
MASTFWYLFARCWMRLRASSEAGTSLTWSQAWTSHGHTTFTSTRCLLSTYKLVLWRLDVFFQIFGSLQAPSCCSCIGSASGPYSLLGGEGCGISSGPCSLLGGEGYGISLGPCSLWGRECCGISGMCSLGGEEYCGISGKWWSQDGESISPSSRTPSKHWAGGEEAVNIMSRLCQRMN